jgi:phage recombination protein Bet
MSEQTRTALEVRKEKAVVTWQGRSITITFNDVKRHICPNATDQEIVVFLRMAQSLNLNPWAREVYLIKYSLEEPASYVIAEESYLKAAEQCPEYNGHEAGIIIKDGAGSVKYEPGTLFLEGEKVELVGGWARVYRKDREHPFFIAVNFKECAKVTRKGELNRFWNSMPATMIRKVALSRALREAFPSRLGGMVTDAEWEDVSEELFPEMLLKDGKPNWPLFYAKIKDELGLTAEQAHKLVGVEHFNDLLNQGWTMERIWDALLAALKKDVIAEGKSVDQATGEIKDAGARSPQPDRDPQSINTINDLLRACFNDFGLQPPDVAKELGYSSTQEITKRPNECYLEIKAVRGQPPQKAGSK